MKAGTIVYAGADLALYGAPQFTLRRTPEPAAPAVATHRRVEVTVTVDLVAEMPATVWARAQRLQMLLAATPEGLLEIRSENGTALSWQATAGPTSLPEAIARRSGRVEMSFSALEALDAGATVGMSIDPLDGTAVIGISRVMDWSENIRVARADSRAGHRAEVAGTVAFTARTAFADPLLPLAERAEFLMEEAERIKGISSKEGRLVFVGFDRTVQFETLNARPSPGWEWLDLEAQARYATLPGDTEAEVDFTVETTEDPATGEIRTTVSGKVEAPEKATATAKVEALLTAWRTPARRVLKILKKDSFLDGEDTEESTPSWVGMDFTLEFTEGTDQTRYTLKIDTREGPDGCRTTYSGSATASTLEVLLATVAAASAGKHPVEIRSELSVEYATDDEGTAKLVQGTFSTEYQTAATRIRGSVSRVTGNGSFGDWQASVSGSISAPTYAAARAVARTFISAGVILRQDDETEEKAFTAVGTTVTDQMVTLAFSYGWAAAHTQTSIQYEEAVSRDYARMVQTTTISGTAWAVDKTTARTDVATLLSSLGLTNATHDSLADSHERQKVGAVTTDRWLAYKFSHTFETAISGTIAHDIIEAQFALQRIGMVNHEPVTEIPLGSPVKQIPFGYNMGRLVASGTVKARQRSTARAWGQAKRASAATSGLSHTGAEDPPDERMAETYLPFNGETVTCYEFSFQYSFRYATGLTGLMA